MQIQHELSTAGKVRVPSVEQIIVFIQRQFQYQQLIPQPNRTRPFNEITSLNNRPPQGTHKTASTNDRPNSSEDCLYCGKRGHKERDCRSKKPEANTQPQDNRQEEPQPERAKYNSKLVCNSCRYTGHSARDCIHRAKGASQSELSRTTSRIRKKTRNCARNSGHHIKGPTERSHRATRILQLIAERRGSVFELIMPRHQQQIYKSAQYVISKSHECVQKQKKLTKNTKEDSEPTDAGNILGTPMRPQKNTLLLGPPTRTITSPRTRD